MVESIYASAMPTWPGEYVKTNEGEIIPRGPVGERSVATTPEGNIINFDSEGLPIQLGPKPEVIKITKKPPNY